MKKIVYTTILLGIVMGFLSCKKYLDITPKGKLIPQKTSDYRLLLNQVSSKGKSKGFWQSFSKDAMVDDDIAINTFSNTYFGANDLNAFQYADHLYLESESDLDWENLYNQIYVANLVATEVMSSEGGTEQEKRQLLAEARVHRAHAYLILVNLYAKQYNPATAGTDLGVPIRTGLDFEEKLPRQTVQKVYDYIITELSQAVPALPLTPDPATAFRPVKPAAYTLLARVSLYMNKPQDAYNYADSSLRCYNKLVDYNKLPPSPQFPDDVLAYPVNFKNEEALMEKTGSTSYPLMYASASLLGLYDTVNDLRFKTLYFPDRLFGLNFGYISTEWSSKSPFKGPSVPETYLIRAESSARLGNGGAAMDDLNQLRKYRYKTGSNYILSASGAAEALELVKAERRRELPFRGFRYFDLKRYNAFDGANLTVTHQLPAGTYTLAPNSPRVLLPIGRKYIALNPEILQNPR